MFGFLGTVSLTVAGSSAVLGTFRVGTAVVVLVVVVDKVVGLTLGGRKVCLVLDVVGRTVALEGAATVVRGSSVQVGAT